MVGSVVDLKVTAFVGGLTVAGTAVNKPAAVARLVAELKV